MGGLDLGRLRRGIMASVSATLAMGVALWLWLRFTEGSSIWLTGGVGVIAGAGMYWLISLVLGAPEARQLPGLLLRREPETRRGNS